MDKMKIRIINTLTGDESTADVEYKQSYSSGKLACQMLYQVETACCYFTNLLYLDGAVKWGIRSPYDKYSCCQSDSLMLYDENDEKIQKELVKIEDEIKNSFTEWINNFTKILIHIEIKQVNTNFNNFPKAEVIKTLLWQISHDDLNEEWYQGYDAKNKTCNCEIVDVEVKNDITDEKVTFLFDINSQLPDKIHYFEKVGKKEIIHYLYRFIEKYAFALINNDKTKIEELSFKIVDNASKEFVDLFPTKEEFLFECGFYK